MITENWSCGDGCCSETSYVIYSGDERVTEGYSHEHCLRLMKDLNLEYDSTKDDHVYV